MLEHWCCDRREWVVSDHSAQNAFSRSILHIYGRSFVRSNFIIQRPSVSPLQPEPRQSYSILSSAHCQSYCCLKRPPVEVSRISRKETSRPLGIILVDRNHASAMVDIRSLAELGFYSPDYIRSSKDTYFLVWSSAI